MYKVKQEILENDFSIRKEIIRELDSKLKMIKIKNLSIKGELHKIQTVEDAFELLGGLKKEVLVKLMEGQKVFLFSRSNSLMTDCEIIDEKKKLDACIGNSQKVIGSYFHMNILNDHYSIEVVDDRLEVKYGDIDSYKMDDLFVEEPVFLE